MIGAACVIRLKREPRYHVAQSGTAVWSGWGLAGDQALSVVAFKALADELNGAGLGEGNSITVHGTLQLESWTGNDGQERNTLKLIATKVEPVRPPAAKRRSRGNDTSAAPAPTDAPFDDPLPF